MKSIFQKLAKIFLVVFGMILSWIIATGILEYNFIIFKFNPVILIFFLKNTKKIRKY